jgi:hypothetical protein
VVIKSQDIMVVYNFGIEGYIKNSIVDYSDSWFERGFVIRGARTSSC